MKVEVLQVEDAKFKWWAFWSQWVDVAVYKSDYVPYLLQMKVSRLNKKVFRSRKITRSYFAASISDVGDLMPTRGAKT